MSMIFSAMANAQIMVAANANSIASDNPIFIPPHLSFYLVDLLFLLFLLFALTKYFIDQEYGDNDSRRDHHNGGNVITYIACVKLVFSIQSPVSLLCHFIPRDISLENTSFPV